MTSPARILVVDDDDDARGVTARVLAREGYEVQEASNGEEALQLVRETPPALVLLDVMLPGLRGDEVLRRIRAAPELEGVSVVLLSSVEVSPEQQAAGLDAGGDDYIPRPVSNRELVARVRAQVRQRHLAEALRASEARLRDLISGQPDAVVVIDRGGTLRFANPAAARLFGKPEASLIGLPFGSPVEDAVGMEIEVPQAGGATALVEMRVAPLQWEGAGAWIATLRDVTERRNAELRLERLNRLHQVVSRTNEAIARTTSEEALFETVCHVAVERGQFRMAAVLRHDRATGLLQALSHFGAEDHYFEEVRLDATDPVLGQGTSATAIRNQRVDICNDLARDPRVAPWREATQRRGYRSSAGFPITVGGEVFGVLALFAGETDYFQEDEVRLLEAVAGDISFAMESLRTASKRRELEDQLRRSQRLESVGQLTGGLAHDFNNLLTVILGNAEVLREQLAGDSHLAPLADMVTSAALRGADLTQRLLAFARKQPLDPRSVDVAALVAGLDPLLRRTLGEHISIGINHGPDLWPALIDPAQLENALLNLSLNARDAMPDGGLLTIETRNQRLQAEQAEKPADMPVGEYVMLEVSDTGSGISPENVQQVFQPFFTTKEPGKGTGLGLAMVYGFIKQSGGHVSLNSEVGRGTTVRMYIPRALATTGQGDKPAQGPQAAGGRETILMVEDDDLVRASARGHLVELGYRVIEASTGAQALEIIRRGEPIDLLFTDVVMPGINGRELADAASRLRPRLKVLFTSGYAEDAIVHDGRLDAGVQLLNKPYRRAELASRIRSVLEAP